MMKSLFRPTTPQDEPRLVRFLAQAFSVPPHTEFLRPDLLQWKYWALREDYADPRSYVLEQSGEIVAHAGIWPMVLQTATEKARGCHMIDWASDLRAPGSGVALVQKFCEMFDFVFAIGGAEGTRKILPIFGLKEVGKAWSAARPLRPLPQMFSHQYRNWKIPARFVRNAFWSMVPLSARCEGWTMDDKTSNEIETDHRLSEVFPSAFRPSAFFRYLESCPTAQIRTFQLHKDGYHAGRMALSFLQKQARVAGVWLDRWSPEGMHAAYCLAEQAARGMDTAFEIVAVGSTSASENAAVSAGFRVLRRAPIFLWRRKTDLPPTPFDFQMADNDAVFQSRGRPDFLT